MAFEEWIAGGALKRVRAERSEAVLIDLLGTGPERKDDV